MLVSVSPILGIEQTTEHVFSRISQPLEQIARLFQALMCAYVVQQLKHGAFGHRDAQAFDHAWRRN